MKVDLVTRFHNRRGYPDGKIEKVQLQVMENSALNQNTKLWEVLREFQKVTGQTPELRYAKKSIASFRLRKGIEIGLNVNIKKNRIINYLLILITMVLPLSREIPRYDISNVGDLHFGIGPYLFETHPNTNILISANKGLSPAEKIFIYSYCKLPLALDTIIEDGS